MADPCHLCCTIERQSQFFPPYCELGNDLSNQLIGCFFFHKTSLNNEGMRIFVVAVATGWVVSVVAPTFRSMEIYIAKGGRESGPFTPEQIPSMLDSGMLSLKDSVWHQDLPEWIPVHRFLNLRPPVPQAVGPEAPAMALPAAEISSCSGEPARFGQRLGASLIDFVLWFVIASIFSGIGDAVFLGGRGLSDAEYERAVLIPAFVIGLIYSAAMESSPWRATVGKRMVGTVVADMEGNPISFWRAARRYSWKTLAFMTFGLTLLPALWTRRRQSVHDLLSHTQVLKK